MEHEQSVIEVRIRLDPIPGWGHDPDDHVKMLQQLLDNAVPHYHPTTKLIKVETER